MLTRLIRLVRPSWRRDVTPFVEDVRAARARGQVQQREAIKEIRHLRQRREAWADRPMVDRFRPREERP